VHADSPRIAIVGGGPMCLYALERMAALLADGSSRAAPRIYVFERSGHFGVGEVNSDVQPPTSLMNRIVAQVGFAADESNAAAGPLLPRRLRPTLHEWLQQRFAKTGDREFALAPSDIPSRRLHGEALKAIFSLYVDLLRASGATVILHGDEVVDVSVAPGDASMWRVHAAGGGHVAADRVLFVTGNAHSFAPLDRVGVRSSGSPGFLQWVYPLDRQLTPESVPPGCTVGIDGLGLTAIDTILYLTEGRGGRFEPARGDRPAHAPRFVYHASGREPARIVAFSPSGMPPCCRPQNFKLTDPRLHHAGRFFTAAAIVALRDSRGILTPDGHRRQLDFDTSVLPLVLLEMGFLYYRTMLGERVGARIDAAVRHRYDRFVYGEGPAGHAGIEYLLAPLHVCVDDEGGVPQRERFDWKRIFDPLAREEPFAGTTWTARLLRFMEWDLAQGQQGNLRNPFKAACDGVLRDLRSVFCAAVDHGGLTPQSHQRFLQGFMRHYTRLSNGAGIDPTAKLLALIEHGVVDVSVGPSPQLSVDGTYHVVRGSRTGVHQRVKLLLHARLPPFDAADPSNTLYGNLLRRGIVRRWVNADGRCGEFCPGGLDLTDTFHPVSVYGTVEQSLTFMGPAAEGQRFFQSAAARPHCGSSVFTALATWARDCLGEPGVRSESQPRRKELYS
jgi:hypothetical protein